MPSARPTTILLVSDDVRQAAAVQRFVERRQVAKITPVRSLFDARAALREMSFDTVVVDVDALQGSPQLLMELSVQAPRTRRIGLGRFGRPELNRLVDAGLVHVSLAKPVDVDEFVRAACAGVPEQVGTFDSQAFSITVA